MPKPLVLVVDDDLDSVTSICDLLSLLGAECQGARTLKEAITAAYLRQPAAAILDVFLGPEDGLELAGRLRAMNLAAPPRIVAVSGVKQGGTLTRAFAAGCDAFLAKPLTEQELRIALRGVLPER